MSNIYGATALTGGGTKALDGSTYYDGDDLVDGAGAIVITESTMYAYHLDASSGAAENSPLVIKPDANAGTKRWLLKEGIFAGLSVKSSIAGGTSISITNLSTNNAAFTSLALKTADSGYGYLTLGDPGHTFVDVANRISLLGGSTLNGVSIAADKATGDIRFYTGGRGNERVRIDENGKVSIGTGNADVRLGQMLDIAVRANYGGMSLSTWAANNALTNLLDFKKSGSDTIGTHVAVENNESLGSIAFRGSDGVEFLDACYIRGVVDGVVAGGGTDDMPGRIEIWTTPDGSATSLLRFTVKSDGGIYTHSLKSGASQGAAGAAANELWRDTADNSIKLGV